MRSCQRGVPAAISLQAGALGEFAGTSHSQSLYTSKKMSLSNFIYEVDKICRKDLSKNIIVSERDYVSQFCALIRFPNGIRSPKNKFLFAATIPGTIERKIGCDSIIIFKIGDMFKIGLFEAKYPRYPSVNPKINYQHWDKDGRFNEQIRKQRIFHIKYPQIVIWNQFFDNGTIGTKRNPFIDLYGSSIITHSDVFNYLNNKPSLNNKHWKKRDLNLALSRYGINIRKLIEKIITCQLGKPLNPIGNSLNVNVEERSENDEPFVVPLLNEENINETKSFMERNDLSNYLLIDTELNYVD